MELCELLRDRLDDVMKKTVKLKTVELDKVRLNIMEEAQQNLSLQTQQELNEEWESESRLEEKQPKVVKILEKAELVMEDNWEIVEEFNVMDIKVIQVIEIYVDFNFSDIYNPSPVSLQGVTYNEDVFEPGNKEIGLPIGYSWIWSYQADIMQAVCKWNEDCWGNRISPQPWCLFDRGKAHVLYCPTMEILDFGQIKS